MRRSTHEKQLRCTHTQGRSAKRIADPSTRSARSAINLETAKGDWRRCATDAARPGGGGDNQLTLRDSYVEPCHRARPRLGGAAQELAAKLAALLLETDGDGHLLLAIAG